jgi:hypothetical protein
MLRDDRPVDPAPYLALARCSGALRTKADMIGPDGKVPPTRVYGLLQKYSAAR